MLLLIMNTALLLVSANLLRLARDELNRADRLRDEAGELVRQVAQMLDGRAQP